MRISDWSSDVCSSDLPGDAVAGDRDVGGDAALLAVDEEALGKALRRHRRLGHRCDELLALGVLADARQVALLVQAEVTQELREAVAVEAARGILAVGILHKLPSPLLLRPQQTTPRTPTHQALRSVGKKVDTSVSTPGHPS